MKIEIKHRWNGNILFAGEFGSLKLALEAAVKSGSDLSGSDLSGSDLSDSNLSDSDLRRSDLRGSNLRGSDLSDSNLRDSNLRGSDLSGSNLRGSNLRDSNLSGSDLRDSNLRDSNLSDSDLSGSNLRGSDLSGSDLRGSDLRGSDLRGSNLRGSNLSGSNLSGAKNLSAEQLIPIRDDLWAVLSSAPREAGGLRKALAEGRVDGSTYTGQCACLVGTIANVRGETVEGLGSLKPNSSRPIERWFMGINKGDTPETNVCAKWALAWTDEWLFTMRAAFAPVEKRTD